jgi:hypothetical protein
MKSHAWVAKMSGGIKFLWTKFTVDQLSWDEKFSNQ